MAAKRIVLDINSMKYIALFHKITHADVKDCIVRDNSIVFVVQPGEMNKAIGKRGANVKRVEAKLKKKVKVVEFNPDILEFVKNVIYPAEIREAVLEDNTVILTAKDIKNRGFLIGREANILRSYEAIVKRYFDIDEIKVN